jgi:ABC-type antimicrobial peptide transport system permease subunit
MALGAHPARILKLVLKQGLVLTLIGLTIGLAVSFALTRFLASQLYNVSTTDLITFALASSVLMVVAMLASFIPAWRAARVDPLVALRYQ